MTKIISKLQTLNRIQEHLHIKVRKNFMKEKKKWKWLLVFILGIIAGLVLRELVRYLFHI